ncbi:uncharacterized protein E5676_scaffold306G00990 [Cucumis melo var. makuwa]|uniref:Uncharacterized protein n=1 Tax=Cucumis melo var. makuwa TaxID=1194695 RepID=A0A5A7TJK8_CUCMM|nr:uncharacterized protein E6C27_scaffold67G003130 [Cucumis melo var. makuwa]TYK17839.1 uncharacterized protein E5676_scaffold306G00990 [Cucumis melo var. makuwa]
MLFRGKYEIRRISESRVENEAEDSEKDEKDNGGRDRDVVYDSSSMPSPPKSALDVDLHQIVRRLTITGTRVLRLQVTKLSKKKRK